MKPPAASDDSGRVGALPSDQPEITDFRFALRQVQECVHARLVEGVLRSFDDILGEVAALEPRGRVSIHSQSGLGEWNDKCPLNPVLGFDLGRLHGPRMRLNYGVKC